MSKPHASQMLWKTTKYLTGYYYEIKLKGVVIDRLPINEPTLQYLKNEGIIT